MIVFIILALPILGLLIIAFIVALILLILRRLWRRSRPNQPLRRSLIVVLALFASPYIAWKVYEHHAILARVPAPLNVASVEYRLEESWGFGPGGNETGFLVYRLSDASTRWAQEQGAQLGDRLPGGSKVWRKTPVDDVSDRESWHSYDRDPAMMSAERLKPHPATVAEYLEKYGFTIPIEEGREVEVDRAIQTPGSFYSSGAGGSVTVVDPGRGKVYFFYAG
jgi:hypothetical protein